MSNQETNQKQIQFPAQQELKHLRTRCGKVYALGNNRFRAVVQTTPVHEYDAATHQWVELSAEKRQQMAAQAHSPIATFADSTNSAENAAGILDTYVKEGSTQNFSHDERLWISNTNYYGNRLTYLKVVDLPRLGANHFITSAKLCVRNVYAPTADTVIMCTEVLEDWDPETITYDHQPDVSGVYQDYCRVLKNQYSWKEFDVTNLARKWYLGDNHGVQLSAPKSESSFSQLHSSETANQPYFVLEYASLAGLESYLTYDHQSAGLAGTGSVSLVNGNLIFAHADTAMNGNRLPVSITHYYNSCDSDKDEFGMGYGWRTSLHQTLHKVLYNGEVEFVYTDGDGTEHFFKKNKDDQKKYSDQSGLSLVSYRLTISANKSAYVRQAVTLTPGKSYTLSGYVRSGGPRGVMRIAYTVGGQKITLDSEPGKVWEKTDNMPYERVSVSFTLPENAEPEVYCMAYCDMQDGFAGGNCWFDAMQLEEGLTLNHFNMVQNSDFSVTGTDGKPKAWTVGKNDASYVKVLPLETPKDEFHAPDCLKHDNTQKIHLLGRYDRTVTYYQQFRHYGKIGDRFTVGGWCSSFAKKNDSDNYIYCRITVQFTSADPVTDKSYWATGGSAVFNAEEGNWQFASAGIVAPNNCTYIRVVLQMNRQMNFADFTGIYLYPEAFGTQYIYDKNGNRKTRKMLYGGQEKSEFDDADNLTKHTAAGRTVSSTFHYGDTEEEQKKHLLLKSIAPLGSVGTFTYDAFGNLLTSQVQNADTNPSYFIRGETSYTDDGNYVTEQKDARGKIVRTETDPQRGTTTSVTDAKGQKVTYEYDNLRRIVKTSANVGAKEGIQTVHNEYTYDAKRGNLVEIRHNTDGNAANDVVYSFEQDALGRQTAVKVGNQTTGTLIHSATI